MTQVAEQVQTTSGVTRDRPTRKRPMVTEDVLCDNVELIMAMSGHPSHDLRIPRDSDGRKAFYAKAKEDVIRTFGTTHSVLSTLINLGSQKGGVDGPHRVRHYILDHCVTAEERAILDTRCSIS